MDADHLAWEVEAAERSRRLGQAGATLLLTATLLWWPLDPWLFDDAGVHAFARLRTHLGLIGALGLALLTLTRPSVRWMVWIPTAGVGSVLFAAGEALGGLGADGADRGQMALLADAWLGVFALALAPMPLGRRVVATLTTAVALILGFFGVHPGNLAVPGAFVQVSYGGFAALFAIGAGAWAERLGRDGFDARCRAERAGADLLAQREALAGIVAARTASLRALAHHLAQAQEAERRRLAHALHDDLGQQLTAMRYALARLRARVDDPDRLRLVDDLQASLDATRSATRDTVTHLRPRVLDDLGLDAALSWLCEDVSERAGVPCTYLPTEDAEVLRAVPADVALALFRVVQEGTTNALRHGEASEIQVRVAREGPSLRVDIADQGAGLPDDFRWEQAEGFGLLGLRERLAAFGGELTLQAGPQRGARLTAWVPHPAREAP